MTDEEIAQLEDGVVLLPMTAGEIVLAYNLPGVDAINLPHDVYPEIFLGNIDNWNDEAIAAANPDVELPDLPITVEVRSDSSGTKFNFTSHLAAISEAFADGPGADKSVQWPASDKIIKAPKNDGITATIVQTPGAIGYIEYGYAMLTGTPMAPVENASGNFVAPRRRRRRGCARLGRVRRPHARVHHRPHGRERLPDVHLHLDDVLRERPGRGQRRGDQVDDRVQPDRRAGDGRGARLHPDARGRGH
jgi:phosphate ABC transporter phosphate-binding protein